MNESFDVGFLELKNGKCPFIDWERKLDKVTRSMIRIRLNRIRLGNLGDSKAISGIRGVYELRIHLGPGYRIYFGKEGDRLIILLCGGNKKTQKGDIQRAKEYWRLYREEMHGKSK